MTRPPDRPTDTYLDVLRTLGVTDAALRRHHDADAEIPLRLAVDRDRGMPTADLLDALASTGRLLDLRDGLDADDEAGLGHALARFGFHVAVTAADSADDAVEAEPADELLLEVADAVTGEIERIPTAPDSDAIEAALRTELLDSVDVDLRSLLDGRHLVAEERDLAALAERYGPRIEPFDDPLLTPEAAIDRDEFEHVAGDDTEQSAVGESMAATTDPTSTETVSWTNPTNADEPTTEAVEAATTDAGPRTHTIEDDALADDAPSVGGGPKRTVSTSGIDGVFDQLESATTATPDHTTMSDSTDDETEDAESRADPVETPQGLTGGPTRTVSSTSADDILERATGDDFDSIAAEEGEADPDAVLADAEEVPQEIEDEVGTGSTDDAPTDGADGERTERVEEESDAGTKRGGATPPAVDPAAPEPAMNAEADGSLTGPETRRIEDVGNGEPSDAVDEGEQDAARDGGDVHQSEARSADEEDLPVVSKSNLSGQSEESDARSPGGHTPSVHEPVEQTETPDADSAVGDDSENSVDDRDEGSERNDASDATVDPVNADRDGGVGDGADAGKADDGEGGIDADLHGDDVELRRGTETVDRGSDPVPDLSAAEADAEDASSADGPLAGAGGLHPDEMGSADASAENGAGRGGEDADETATDGEAADDAESTDSGQGLVGRITSRLFGE